MTRLACNNQCCTYHGLHVFAAKLRIESLRYLDSPRKLTSVTESVAMAPSISPANAVVDLYTISPDPTAFGLSFDSTTGIISRTDTLQVRQQALTFYVTASNLDSMAIASVIIQIASTTQFKCNYAAREPIFLKLWSSLDPSVAPMQVPSGAVYQTEDGDSTVTGLPPGVSLNSQTGEISGTATAVGSWKARIKCVLADAVDFTNVSVVVTGIEFTHAQGCCALCCIMLTTVHDSVTVGSFQYSRNPAVLHRGEMIEAGNAPRPMLDIVGRVPMVRYTNQSVLPAGLTLDGESGAIHGTAKGPDATTTVVITANTSTAANNSDVAIYSCNLVLQVIAGNNTCLARQVFAGSVLDSCCVHLPRHYHGIQLQA